MNKERNNSLDYLKGISIIAVVLYHLGILKSGYLGVDIFFVINGFLLVPKMIDSIASDNFKYGSFLKKRLTRIYPLVILVGLACIVLGVFAMLPDDLENLSESVVASLACSNNVLSWITTNSYWDMSNELKPLMHLWYIGILVEFYVIFPIILIVINNLGKCLKINSKKFLVNFVVLFWGISLVAFCLPFVNVSIKFYFLPFRLFEILSGGLSALYIKGIANNCVNNTIKNVIYVTSNTIIIILLLCGLLSTDFSRWGNEVVAIGGNMQIKSLILPNTILVLTIVAFTCLCLISGCSRCKNNKIGYRIICYVGIASYSIFIWHQPIIAFYRYMISFTLDVKTLLFYFIAISSISYLSYRFFENINYKNWWDKALGTFLMISLFIGSLYIYNNAGIMKDIPELNISVANAHRGMNSEYVDRIYNYNKAFSDNDKKKVLLIGNSYARDWGNILLESKVAENIEISYIDNLDISYCDRIKGSDFIFVYSLKSELPDFFWDSVDSSNSIVYGIGTKNFGRTMGEIYSKRFSENYYSETIELDKSYVELNRQMKAEWKSNYIDLLRIVQEESGRIKVFTDNDKYISPDGYHLTSAGAKYFANNIKMLDLLDE